MKKAIQKNLRSFLALAALVAVALPVGVYILKQQRLRIPLLDPKPLMIKAELAEGNAVTPGQGQTAQVSGVQIGQIGKVELDDGRAVVTMEIEPRFGDVIHTDAQALLRPRTGLKDMYIQIFPGSPKAPLAKAGHTIPVANTATDVDLDEILAALDVRTREYLRLFISGAGSGLRDNGVELAEVFKRFEPTMRDLRTVNRSVSAQRVELRRLITSLANVNERLARKPEDLSELVETSAATFGAFASEDDDLRDTISELDPTLEQTTRTLRDVRPFAQELGPTSRRLIPVFRELDRANDEIVPLAREGAPIIRDNIRPFVRASRPLTRDLKPAAQSLAASFPELQRSGRVFNRFFNLLSHNPNGAEGPNVAGREEGFLFWLAWTLHNTTNLQNIDDANGPMRPIFLTGTCSTLQTLVENEPEIEFAMNLSPVLATVCGNERGPSVDLEQAALRDPGLGRFLERREKAQSAREKAQAPQQQPGSAGPQQQQPTPAGPQPNDALPKTGTLPMQPGGTTP